jgi:hypothetical protein
MRIVGRAIAIVFALSTGALPVSAQEPGSPEALRAATDLFAILSKDMISQMVQQMTAQIWPQIEAESKSKVDEATLFELRSEFERVLLKFVTEEMRTAPPIYARYFSVQELRDIAAFYKSPTGARTLQFMPMAMGEMTALMVKNLPDFMREMDVSLEYVLRKHGYKK